MVRATRNFLCLFGAADSGRILDSGLLFSSRFRCQRPRAIFGAADDLLLNNV